MAEPLKGSVLQGLVLFIMIRGVSTQTMLFKMASKLESLSPDQLIIVDLFKKSSNLPQVFNTILSAVVSFLFLGLWIIFLIYMECNKYQINVELLLVQS